MTEVIDVAPPRFETLGPLLVAGLAQRHDCQSPGGIPDQWQRFVPHLGKIPAQVGSVAYGVCHNFDGEGNFEYLCAVEVKRTDELPQGFASLLVAPQKYAVFSHPGHVAGIRATCTAIWKKWFPTSGHQPVNAPMFERYGPEFNGMTGLGGLEIWIPVQG
jgi:AraC family transcriptional regulator